MFVGIMLFKCLLMNFSMISSSQKFTDKIKYQEKSICSIFQQTMSQIYNELEVKMLVLDGNQKNCCYHSD